jgi:hypothetical protein
MNLPLNGYARLEITPGVEGQITIEEMYPDGQVRSYGMGYVKPFHTYKMWFYADTSGTHKMRYNVNGYYSNILEFYVQGNGNGNQNQQGWSTPTQKTGATIGRSGSSIVRSSGFSGSGYSSTSSSSGSMTISTSFG